MSECLPLSRVLHAEYNHLYPDAPLPDGIRDDLTKVVEELHKHERTALCISGSGLRGATFTLGVIQGLAKLGKSAAYSVLNHIDYLSTVSGGGYIGSWLSGWSQRSGGILNVITELRRKPLNKLGPDPMPVHHLREYSNYLRPQFGLLSTDTWAFLGAYLRNLLLTWLVLVPFLLSILAVPRLFVSIAVNRLFISSGVFIYAAAALFCWSLAFVGLTRPTAKPAPKQYLYSNGAFLIFCVLPLCLFAVTLVISHAWFPFDRWTNGLWIIIGFATTGTVLSSAIYTIRKIHADGARVLRKQFAELLATMVSGTLFAVMVYGFLVQFRSPLRLMDPTDIMAWVNGQVPILNASLPASYIVFGVPLVILAVLLQATVFLSATGRFSEDFDLEWWERAAAWLIIAGLAWLLLTSIVIYGPMAIYRLPTISALGGISAVAAIIKFLKPSERHGSKTESAFRRSLTVGLGFAVPIAAIGLLAAFIVAVTLLMHGEILRSSLERRYIVPPRPNQSHVALLNRTTWTFEQKNPRSFKPLGTGEQKLTTIQHPAMEAHKLKGLDHLYVMERTPLSDVTLLFITSMSLSILASFFVDVNRFSMHALLRNRLVRAYLGASNGNRRPHPFTGFDPADDIPMSQLLHRPMHVVNMALNLHSGESLAWLRRSTKSFIATPLHCGSLALGYRRTAEYAGVRGMSLGTAAAISGVAANPNIGYHASPALGMLLTLFNVRLGWWLGNPGVAGNTTYRLGQPRTSLGALLSEAFGNLNPQNRYVYLSDGRHFENLGFYEMVLRRCHNVIIVGDTGTEDTSIFNELEKTMALIKIDLGIRVMIERAEKHYAAGRILYSDIDQAAPDGNFVYIRPIVRGTEYENADQLPNELQFETYRSLGEYTVNEICEIDRIGETKARARRDEINTVEEFMHAVRKYANPTIS